MLHALPGRVSSLRRLQNEPVRRRWTCLLISALIGPLGCHQEQNIPSAGLNPEYAEILRKANLDTARPPTTEQIRHWEDDEQLRRQRTALCGPFEVSVARISTRERDDQDDLDIAMPRGPLIEVEITISNASRLPANVPVFAILNSRGMFEPLRSRYYNPFGRLNPGGYDSFFLYFDGDLPPTTLLIRGEFGGAEYRQSIDLR